MVGSALCLYIKLRRDHAHAAAYAYGLQETARRAQYGGAGICTFFREDVSRCHLNVHACINDGVPSFRDDQQTKSTLKIRARAAASRPTYGGLTPLVWARLNYFIPALRKHDEDRFAGCPHRRQVPPGRRKAALWFEPERVTTAPSLRPSIPSGYSTARAKTAASTTVCLTSAIPKRLSGSQTV